MENFWVLDIDQEGPERLSLQPPDLYRADRTTMEDYLAIQRIYEPKFCLRLAKDEDRASVRQAGYEIEYIHLDPACRDWLLQIGIGKAIAYTGGNFDATPETYLYRGKSLTEMFNIARQRSDGLCHVLIRPATPGEISADDAEMADHERRESEWNLRILAMLLFGVKPWDASAMVRLRRRLNLAFCFFPLFFGYLGLRLLSRHPGPGALLLIPIVSLTGRLVWAGLKRLTYQIGFILGKGLQDGKSERGSKDASATVCQRER